MGEGTHRFAQQIKAGPLLVMTGPLPFTSMVTPEDDHDDGCGRPRVSITVLDRRLCSYPVAVQASEPVVVRLLARFLEPGHVISK